MVILIVSAILLLVGLQLISVAQEKSEDDKNNKKKKKRKKALKTVIRITVFGLGGHIIATLILVIIIFVIIVAVIAGVFITVLNTEWEHAPLAQTGNTQQGGGSSGSGMTGGTECPPGLDTTEWNKAGVWGKRCARAAYDAITNVKTQSSKGYFGYMQAIDGHVPANYYDCSAFVCAIMNSVGLSYEGPCEKRVIFNASVHEGTPLTAYLGTSGMIEWAQGKGVVKGTFGKNAYPDTLVAGDIIVYSGHTLMYLGKRSSDGVRIWAEESDGSGETSVKYLDIEFNTLTPAHPHESGGTARCRGKGVENMAGHCSGGFSTGQSGNTNYIICPDDIARINGM